MQRTAELRNLVLNRLVRMMAIIGAIAYVPSLYASLRSGMWLLAAADSLSFAVFVAAAASRRVGPKIKLAIVICGSLAISGLVLFSTGSEGAGYIWLIASILIASLLGSRLVLGLTAACAILILGGYMALVALGKSPFDDNLLMVSVIAANLFLICAIIARLARTLIDGLEEAYAEKARLMAKLGEELAATKAADEALHEEMGEKERLLKELDHRVRNNMQIVLSLLDIENSSGTGDPVAETRRRIRVLARANDIALTNRAAANARSLAAAALSGYRLSGGESAFAIEDFSLGLDIERISSVTIALAETGEALARLGLPVAVSLEGGEGEESLVFRWNSARAVTARAVSARELCERLNANSLVGALASPDAVSAVEPESGGEASLSLRLAYL